MKKRFIAVLLLAVMALSLLSFSAAADGAWSIRWDLSRTGALTVQGYGEIADNWVTSDSRNSWLSKRADIKTAEVGSGFTAVGAGVFADCPNLTRVTLPATVTKLGSGVFTGSNRLTEVVYGGTEAAWRAAGGANAGLPASAKVTFRGEAAPTPAPTTAPTPAVTPVPVEKPDVLHPGEWKLNWALNRGTLTIVGYGEIPDGYLSMRDKGSWSAYVSDVTAVDVQEYLSGIGTGVFQNHPNLKTVRLRARVTRIAPNAFSGSSRITDVYYAGTEAAWKAAGGESAGLPASAVVHFGGQPAPAPIPVVSPEPTGGFVDVPSGQFYTDAVAWAVKKQITNGTDATHFSPDMACTRAQVVTFLWRAKGSPAPRSARNPFVDVRADDYYRTAVLWAVEQGITNGTDANHFSPDMVCTRAHVVTFLWRAEGSRPAGSASAFVDVPAGEYYAQAVAWAVQKQITNGTDATHFSPDLACTRAQVVTFLWRDLA